MLNLTLPCTQQQFGELVGISQQSVSRLVADGTLQPGEPATAWIAAYCEKLRASAEHRQPDGMLDLVQERAALARAQREGLKIRNQKLQHDFAQVELLNSVLSLASRFVAARIDALPHAVRAAMPNLPEAACRVVETLLASARHEWTAGTGSIFHVDPESEPDDSEESGEA